MFRQPPARGLNPSAFSRMPGRTLLLVRWTGCRCQGSSGRAGGLNRRPRRAALHGRTLAAANPRQRRIAEPGNPRASMAGCHGHRCLAHGPAVRCGGRCGRSSSATCPVAHPQLSIAQSRPSETEMLAAANGIPSRRRTRPGSVRSPKAVRPFSTQTARAELASPRRPQGRSPTRRSAGRRAGSAGVQLAAARNPDRAGRHGDDRTVERRDARTDGKPLGVEPEDDVLRGDDDSPDAPEAGRQAGDGALHLNAADAARPIDSDDVIARGRPDSGRGDRNGTECPGPDGRGPITTERSRRPVRASSCQSCAAPVCVSMTTQTVLPATASATGAAPRRNVVAGGGAPGAADEGLAPSSRATATASAPRPRAAVSGNTLQKVTACTTAWRGRGVALPGSQSSSEYSARSGRPCNRRMRLSASSSCARSPMSNHSPANGSRTPAVAGRAMQRGSGLIRRVSLCQVLADQRELAARVEVRGDRGKRRRRAFRLLDEERDAVVGVDVDDPVPGCKAKITAVVEGDGRGVLVPAPEPDIVGEAESNRLSPATTSRSSSMPARSMTYFRSPIAPSLSSFVLVPSSWTTTPGAAQSRKSEAKRVFVTTWVSSTSVTSRIFARIQSRIGRPPTGRSGFGTSSVSGRRRVAYPPASTTAFTRPPRRRGKRRTGLDGRRAR